MKKPFVSLLIVISVALVLIGACSPPVTQIADTPANLTGEGERIYNQHCASCHAKDADTVIVGPALGKIGAQAGLRVEGQDAWQYIENAILHPGEYVLEGYPNVMPPDYDKKLSGQEIDELVVYLLTLK
ncbi:c-type cytochrome [Chloroflexota bacterium]